MPWGIGQQCLACYHWHLLGAVAKRNVYSYTLLGYYTNFYYLLTVDNTISTVVKISLKKLISAFFQIIKENMIFKWLLYNRLNTYIQYRGLFPSFLDNVILQKFYK